MDYAHILSNFCIGPHPQGIEDIETLRQEPGISAVLNLQTDEDMRARNVAWELLGAHYQTCGIEVRRVPVRDEVVALGEKLPECVRALNQLLVARHLVYLHCTFGAGRSPTVAVAYLHWCLGWDLDPAFAYVKELRQCSPSLESIRLANWAPPNQDT